MNGCSLDAAFPTLEGAPVPGCSSNTASKEARKEERRKAKKCKGPPLEFLNWQDGAGGEQAEKDPDRQHLERPLAIPPMNRATGLRQHAPVTAPQGEMEPFENVIGSSGGGFRPPNGMAISGAPLGQSPAASATQTYESQRARIQVVEESPRNNGNPDGDWARGSLTITPGQTEQPISRVPRARFFGAEPDAGAGAQGLENFADYKPNARNYLLEPDFRTAFQAEGVGKAGSGAAAGVESLLKGGDAALPIPSVADYWKPLTKGGSSNSAFFERLPAPSGEYSGGTIDNADSSSGATVNNRVVMKKLDEIFARLDDLQRGGSAEQAQMEVLIFISSGIFLLFAMDLLLKKGTTMRFLRG
jgi:hypothetical protein